MADRLFPLPSGSDLSPRQILYLRMVEWLIRVPGSTIEFAKDEAAKFARSSIDPTKDLDMMRDIERLASQPEPTKENDA